MSEEIKRGSQGKLGFIGVGVMGGPMASNLLRAGFDVTVFDQVRSQCDKLAPLGASVAASPREVAAASPIVITMVPDTAVVEEVLFGENGVASGVKAGAIVIDMSTISPYRHHRIRQASGGVGMRNAGRAGKRWPQGRARRRSGNYGGRPARNLRTLPADLSTDGQDDYLYRPSG